MTSENRVSMLPVPELDGSLQQLLQQALSAGTEFAAEFYAQVFRLAPEARRLFGPDLRVQEEKLTQSLLLLLASLDQPEVLAPELRMLGARHVHYGVAAGHYLIVGQALAAALQARCGALSTEQEQQWWRLYGWVAATMLEGAIRHELQ